MTWMPQCVERTGFKCGYSLPAIAIRPPGSGACTPEMILISVDLPEPFSPTRQCTSPASSVRSTLRSAWTPPKRFEMPDISRNGAKVSVSNSVKVVLEDSAAGCAPAVCHRPDARGHGNAARPGACPERDARSQSPPAIRPSTVSLLMRMILSTLICLPGTSTAALPRPGTSTPSVIGLPLSTSEATATIA